MKKLTLKFRDNLTFIYSCFLLLFVPLYPKLPLFDLIPGYIVRVRIEDFLILFAVLLIFFTNLKTKFKNARTPLDRPIIYYLAIGFFSMLSALIITKTVFWEPLHSGKMLIHWMRRIEYFSVFYIFYLSIKNKTQIKIALIVFFVALFGINIYGFGQKYLQWPVYSTMNREFSKGWRLVLTEHARVVSTFGGHYDLAAYLVMALVFSGSIFLFIKNIILKAFSLIIFISSIFLLVLTASRTSFISYIVALIILIIIWSVKKRNLVWIITRSVFMIYLSFFIMLSFGELNERFAQIMGVKQIWALISFAKQPVKIDVPKHLTLEQELSLIAVESDVPPKVVNKGASGTSESKELPPDVEKDIPERVIITYTTDKFGKKIASYSAVPRGYSPAAFNVGLSAAIRLDALWPRALKAFKTNPLLGTGYSTLTKESVSQFTEAESTDNDYLRALGETGLLGLLSFFGIIFYCLYLVGRKLKKLEIDFKFAFLSAYIAGTFGLLVNASYIDVFEASKVAFIYWAMTGITLKLIALGKD